MLGGDYKLEKLVWSEEDRLEEGGLHDATIYAIGFLDEAFELVLDIDYVFHCEQQPQPSQHLTCWVAPCTLVFANVYDTEVELGPYGPMSIDEIDRSEPGVPRNAAYIGRDADWKWIIVCARGRIAFRSTGYTMFVRTRPVSGGRTIPLTAREGISFDRTFAGRERV